MKQARPSPLRNRVDPYGRLIAVPERGAWMGNRGRLHDKAYRIAGRGWTTRAWITCLPSFKGRRRAVMSPRRYTELFFLDEATAFAAGHRPCGECRRAAFTAFKSSWLEGNAERGLGRDSPIARIDAVIHRERLARAPWSQVPAQAVFLGDLPDGAMVGDDVDAWLLWRGSLRRWTPAGYEVGRELTPDVAIRLITPWSILRAFAAGYRPTVHRTAERG